MQWKWKTQCNLMNLPIDDSDKKSSVHSIQSLYNCTDKIPRVDAKDLSWNAFIN